MNIGGLRKCSLVDYPGKPCAVLFTQGCNFRCPYCHNPQLVDPARFEEPLNPETVGAFLDRRQGQLEAVTLSGGEPTLQPDLAGTAAALRQRGFAVKLDTNGSSPRVLGELLSRGLLDFVAMDLKAPPGRYSEIAGVAVNEDAITQSTRLIRESGVDHEFRTTWIPGLLSGNDIVSIARTIPGARRFAVQHCRPGDTLSPLPEEPQAETSLSSSQRAAIADLGIPFTCR